jgi:hypothetical protein
MPLKDDRAAVLVGAKDASTGRRTVQYRSTNGRTYSAMVLAAGTASGLKLSVGSGSGKRIIDNVAKATGLKQTNVYWSRSESIA